MRTSLMLISLFIIFTLSIPTSYVMALESGSNIEVDNYLDNAGAENGTQSWQTFGGGNDIQASTLQAHTGTHSFLSTGRTAFYHGPVTNIKPLVDSEKLLNSERYTASVWVYHTESTPKNLYLNIKQVEGQNTDYHRLEDELVPPNQWVKIVKHFVLDINTSLQSLDLYLVSARGETFDFYSDDFFLGALENYTPPLSSQASDFIKAQGKQLVVGAANTPLILKGINVTVPTDADDTTEDIWDVKSISQKDFHNIKSMGFNAIRLHMNYKTFEDDNNIGVFKQDGWHWLDRAISYAKQAGLYVLLDMHAGQGGYQSDKTPGFSAFWDGLGTFPNSANQARLLKLWEAIAARYQHETAILGYDLLNEPRPNDSEEWLTYAEQLIAAIRTKDSQHLIVLEVPFINNYTMRTVSDSNVLYDSHSYAIWGYSTQYSVHYGKAGQRWGAYNPSNPLYIDPSWNVVWTPEQGGTPPANSQAFDKGFLETVLVDDILEFANSHAVPVNVGEYGSVIETFQHDVGALDLIKDTHRIFAGENRYAIKANHFYFTYQSSAFGIYGNWQGFQVNEASANTALKALFSQTGSDDNTDNSNSDENNTTNTNNSDNSSESESTDTDNSDNSSESESTNNENSSSNEGESSNNDNDASDENESTNNDNVDLRLEFAWGNYPKIPVIGRPHKFKARIYNDSDYVATDSLLKIALPEGATLHSGKNCEVTDEGQFITCALGNIPANQRRTRTVYIRLNQGGEIALNATALSAIEDANMLNNTVTTSVMVSDSADLSVKFKKIGKARLGKALVIKIVTKNKGPAPAEQVETQFSIPSNTTFISASSACDFNADWDEVICKWDKLSRNAKRTVRIYIRPLDKETMNISATTEADSNDPQSANNYAETSVVVK